MERSKRGLGLRVQRLVPQENLGPQPLKDAVDPSMKNQWESELKHWAELGGITYLTYFGALDYLKLRHNILHGQINYLKAELPSHLRSLLTFALPYSPFLPVASANSEPSGTSAFSAGDSPVTYYNLPDDELVYKMPDAQNEYGSFNQRLHDLQEEVFSGEFARKHPKEPDASNKPPFREWPKNKKTEPYEI